MRCLNFFINMHINSWPFKSDFEMIRSIFFFLEIFRYVFFRNYVFNKIFKINYFNY